MNTEVIVRKSSAVLLAFLLITFTLFAALPVKVSAEETQKLVTNYSDLWTSTEIAVKVGETVKWYVDVPEDTEPRGCGATIKIPGLGFGTDTHNREEGHIVLQKGENFIYEFTPDETGDILFTCWMGSGCHSNYIHVTEDGSYSVPKPSDPTDISAVREGDITIVSFTAPEAPKGSTIVGYTVTATAEDGTRKKATVTESPAILEGLDESLEYTIVVVTKGTSGKSAGENKFVLEAVKHNDTDSQADTEEQPEQPDDTSSETEHDTDTTSENDNDKPSVDTGSADDQNNSEEQIIVTEYSELWTGNITVKAGVHVKWYVNVPEGTELNGCAKTIKIPGLGWGTDTHNKEEGHLTLGPGNNFVYEFTPTETGDILFTCWMGSGCHYNYIHVTADGKPDPDAKTGSSDTDSHSDSDSKTSSSSSVSADSKTDSKPASNSSSTAKTGGTNTTAQTAAANTADNANPATGENSIQVIGSIVFLLFLTMTAAAGKKRKHSDE